MRIHLLRCRPQRRSALLHAQLRRFRSRLRHGRSLRLPGPGRSGRQRRMPPPGGAGRWRRRRLPFGRLRTHSERRPGVLHWRVQRSTLPRQRPRLRRLRRQRLQLPGQQLAQLRQQRLRFHQLRQRLQHQHGPLQQLDPAWRNGLLEQRAVRGQWGKLSGQSLLRVQLSGGGQDVRRNRAVPMSGRHGCRRQCVPDPEWFPLRPFTSERLRQRSLQSLVCG